MGSILWLILQLLCNYTHCYICIIMKDVLHNGQHYTLLYASSWMSYYTKVNTTPYGLWANTTIKRIKTKSLVNILLIASEGQFYNSVSSSLRIMCQRQTFEFFFKLLNKEQHQYLYGSGFYELYKAEVTYDPLFKRKNPS